MTAAETVLVIATEFRGATTFWKMREPLPFLAFFSPFCFFFLSLLFSVYSFSQFYFFRFPFKPLSYFLSLPSPSSFFSTLFRATYSFLSFNLSLSLPFSDLRLSNANAPKFNVNYAVAFDLVDGVHPDYSCEKVKPMSDDQLKLANIVDQEKLANLVVQQTMSHTGKINDKKWPIVQTTMKH